MAGIPPAQTFQKATKTTREILGGILTRQAHRHKTQQRQMCSCRGSQGTSWTFPKADPQPVGLYPLPCSPVHSRVGPGQSLHCAARRALRGAVRPYVCAAISAEASNSCIVSDHLSTTTPCQYAERNAETSTVPLDTHLFFRVNFPELLCKLLACRMSS